MTRGVGVLRVLNQHLCIPMHDGMCLSILVTCVKLREGPSQPSAIYPVVVHGDTTRLAARPKAPENTYIALGPFIFKEQELCSSEFFRCS